MPENTKNFNKRILIAGGSGLVGNVLTNLLLQKGYLVGWLTRNPNQNVNKKIKLFGWQPAQQQIDKQAIEWADAIVNLTGTAIAGQRWTKQRKDSIYNSRVLSTRLLVNQAAKAANPVTVLVNASATGYYGAYPPQGALDEATPVGPDFLGMVTNHWEAEVKKAPVGLRTVMLRIGIVLSQQGGALPQLAQTRRLGFLVPVGSGKQFMPWVHIADVARAFIFAIENDQIDGAYNLTAPKPVTQKQFMKILAKACGGNKLVLPAVPSFLIKMAFGQMADIVLGGGCVVPNRLLSQGFNFKFETLPQAVEQIFCQQQNR